MLRRDLENICISEKEEEKKVNIKITEKRKVH